MSQSRSLGRLLLLAAGGTLFVGCGFGPHPATGTVACKPQGGACCPEGYVCVGRGVSTAGGPSAGTCWSEQDLPPEAVVAASAAAGASSCRSTVWLPPELAELGGILDAGTADAGGPAVTGRTDGGPGSDAASDGSNDGGMIIVGPAVSSMIVAGNNQTYLVADGRLWGWGINTDGRLGDGTTTQRMHPTPIQGLQSGVQAVATYLGHTCAVANGGVYCWGRNDHGQLGNNSTTNSMVPVPVVGLGPGSGVEAVAVGGAHTCALVRGGVQCWGLGEHGELGDGSRVDTSIPVRLPDLLSGVTTIVAGEYHTCALVNGGVRCWGGNYQGQLGIDTDVQSYKIPVAAVGLESGVTALSAYYWHSCAVVQGGVRCWGNNDSGELGDGTTKLSRVPVPVAKLPAWATGVVCGGGASCAIVEPRAVLCWGSTLHYLLGNGTLDQSAKYPTQVEALKADFKSLAVGGGHACAITGAGVKCWGSNLYGQLGVDDRQYSAVPVAVQFQ